MNSQNTVKQFKLNSGEEIVCEILEYADEDYYDLLIRRAFEIKCIMGPDQTRYYAMKPWMTVSEGKDNLISLNTSSIIGEANPSSPVMKHYLKAVQESEMTPKEIKERLQKILSEKIDEEEVLMDEGDIEDIDNMNRSNIIDFPRKKPTLH